MHRCSKVFFQDIQKCRYWHQWHDLFECVTWLSHTCDMTHSYVWLPHVHGSTFTRTSTPSMYMWMYLCGVTGLICAWVYMYTQTKSCHTSTHKPCTSIYVHVDVHHLCTCGWRLRWENEIQWHSKCNRLYIHVHVDVHHPCTCGCTFAGWYTSTHKPCICGWCTCTPSTNHVQPVAFGVSFLQSQISINDLYLQVSFATFRWKDNEIETEESLLPRSVEKTTRLRRKNLFCHVPLKRQWDWDGRISFATFRWKDNGIETEEWDSMTFQLQ